MKNPFTQDQRPLLVFFSSIRLCPTSLERILNWMVFNTITLISFKINIMTMSNVNFPLIQLLSSLIAALREWSATINYLNEHLLVNCSCIEYHTL